MIPITRLSVGEGEADAAAAVVRSGWIAQGSRVERFEQMVAEYVGARCGIAVSSATTGLHLALIAAGLEPGDEVICPSFSFIATANAIVYAGGKPVFIDIDPQTYNIDVARIEDSITDRTKVIMPVSQIGLPANLPEVIRIARKYGLRVVEDAAPSLGSAIGGQRVGSISDLTVFSFDPRKILTTGEGGMITTDDERAAERLRALRAHAASVSMLTRHTSSSVVLEEYPELGYNYKMTDIQAAIGIVQMEKIEAYICERRRLAQRYAERLANNENIKLPLEPVGYHHVYQSYCLSLESNISRLAVMSTMANYGVATRRITAIHEEPYYRKLNPRVVLRETENLARQAFLVPMFVGLTDDELDYVCDHLVTAVERAITK